MPNAAREKEYRQAADRARTQRQKDRKQRSWTIRVKRTRAATPQLNRESAKVRRLNVLLAPDYPEGVVRPVTRADCAGGSRPCPFVSCRYHLYLDVTAVGNIKMNFAQEPDEIPRSCSLDVADEGGTALEVVGMFMNLTRERVRQIEVVALEKLEANPTMVEASSA